MRRCRNNSKRCDLRNSRSGDIKTFSFCRSCCRLSGWLHSSSWLTCSWRPARCQFKFLFRATTKLRVAASQKLFSYPYRDQFHDVAKGVPSRAYFFYIIVDMQWKEFLISVLHRSFLLSIVNQSKWNISFNCFLALFLSVSLKFLFRFNLKLHMYKKIAFKMI